MKRLMRKSQSGYGLALLMVFMASSILIGTSFQLISSPVSMATIGRASQTNLLARQVAMAGLATVEADIQTKLNAGQTITTAYRYPASGTVNISAPTDPANLAGASTVVGSYYGTVTLARGSTYMVKINANSESTNLEYTKLLQANNATYVAPPPYDCSTVEAAVLAGTIATLTNAQLIEYAQNNCMVKTASVTVTPPNAGSGVNGYCGGTFSGSGTYNMVDLSYGCEYFVTGTYSVIQLKSTATGVGQYSSLWSYPSSGSRTIHIPGTVGSYSTLAARQSSGGTRSSLPHTFLFGSSAAPVNSYVVQGGTGNDIVSFDGDSTADIYTYGGVNTIAVKGKWGTAADGNVIEVGNASSGTNNVYINTIQSSATLDAIIRGYSTGSINIYFNNLAGGNNVELYGEGGNDIISCGVSFDGGTPACGTISAGRYRIIGYGGNDIISIDAMLPSQTHISADAGNNIIYSKGCGVGVAIYNNASTEGLVISGGNRGAGCSIYGANGNSVLMKKSGTTDAGTISGFTRIITY